MLFKMIKVNIIRASYVKVMGEGPLNGLGGASKCRACSILKRATDATPFQKPTGLCSSKNSEALKVKELALV